jgi:hypothetical protein
VAREEIVAFLALFLAAGSAEAAIGTALELCFSWRISGGVCLSGQDEGLCVLSL